MRKFLLSIAALVAIMLPLFCTAPAQAQATRTWVSGVGDDVNPCSRTAPCKTFAGAISKTAAGGEINCLDPGGFGGLTITKSITVSCETGTAGVLVSGTNGMTVNPGVGGVVVLRGLDFDGVGTGLVGIDMISGTQLHIDNCTVRNFRGGTAAGLNVRPSGSALVYVTDSSFIANGTGVIVRPTGTGSARVILTRIRADGNTTGIQADGSGGTGGVAVTVRDSSASANASTGLQATSTGTAVAVNVDQSAVSSNIGTGVSASGAGALVRLGNTTVFNNATGVSGTVQSYRNNYINGNASDGTPLTVVPGGITPQGGGVN